MCVYEIRVFGYAEGCSKKYWIGSFLRAFFRLVLSGPTKIDGIWGVLVGVWSNSAPKAPNFCTFFFFFFFMTEKIF